MICKNASVIATLIGSLFLASCVEVQVSIDLQPDGSQNLQFEIRGATVALMNEVDEISAKFREDGFTVTQNTDWAKEETVIRATASFPKNDWRIPTWFVKVDAESEYKGEFTDYWILKKYQFHYKVRTVQSQEFTQEFPIKYSISAPGQIVSTNSHLTLDGKSIWQYTIGKDEWVDIHFETEDYNSNRILLIVAVLLVIIASLIVILLIRRS